MGNFFVDISVVNEIEESNSKGKKLFERIGGLPTLERVHQIFYEKIFHDPWMSLYFGGINRQHIENQQTGFMTLLMGGPKDYGGRMPFDAHIHMMITEELFAHRHQLLAQSLKEAGIAEKESQEWLKIDLAFKKVLIKKDISDCKKRFNTDEILDFPDPTLNDTKERAS